MALLTDIEIKEAIKSGEIELDPFDEEKCLQGSSYDMRLGKKGIVTKSVTLEDLKGKVQREEIKEINIEKEESINIPGGCPCLPEDILNLRIPRTNIVGYREHDDNLLFGISSPNSRAEFLIPTLHQFEERQLQYIEIPLFACAPALVMLTPQVIFALVPEDGLEPNSDRIRGTPFHG